MSDQIAEALLAKLSQQGQIPPGRDAATPLLDFPAAFRQVAEQFEISPEEAERVVRVWAAKKSKSSNLSARAQAEFLSANFSEATRLSEESANEKLQRADNLAAERGSLVDSAVRDLERAGEALLADGKPLEALARFERALDHVSRPQSPQTWCGVRR